MRHISFLSIVSLSLMVGACSDDPEESTPNDTQMSAGGSAGTGGNGAAGSVAGSAGMQNSAAGNSMTGSGGTVSSGEGVDDDLALNGAAGSRGMGGAMSTGGSSSTGVDAGSETDAAAAANDESMSFFVTSRGGGSGGDFGGLAGADAFCAELATEVSAELGAKSWRAYLSTSTEAARDRIGAGPWRNANGVIIATSVAQLHDPAQLDATWTQGDRGLPLDEQGNEVPTQPLAHDIVTGSNADGTASGSGTCSDWTSQQGTTRNGHSDRQGGGNDPTSWSSSHDTGCGEPTPGQNFEAGTVSQGGGQGSIYCFVAN